MKKLFFVILSAGLMLSACKKDKEMPTNNGFNPQDDKAVEARIKSFNQSLQQKQGEPMTVSDATWDIEAALNYNYCKADLQQGLTSQDSIFFEMPVNDGTVSFSNVSEAYNQAVAKIQTLLKGQNLHLVVIDVKPLQTTGVYKAKVTFVVSNDAANESKDVYFTTAATQIAYYINMNMVPLPNDGYYTDIETVEDVSALTYESACINPNWNSQYYNYYYYRMFINDDALPQYHTSLSSAEISFYETGTCTVMNTYTTSGGPRPVGKRATSVYLWGDYIVYNENNVVLHRGNFSYGIPHTTPPAN